MLFIRNIIILGDNKMKNIILPQIVTTGIYNSSIAAKNKTITKTRRTTMFEIEIPIENGGISYIEKEQRTIKPDMIICAKPGQLRHTKTPYKCYYVHMILKEGSLYDILMKTPSFVTITNYSEYQDIFKGLYKYQKTETEHNSIILQSLILKLIYMLGKDFKKQEYHGKLKSSGDDVIEKTINHIKEHLTEDLSLEAVSKVASFSPTHFHSCFKVATGKTLHEYVEEQRIKKAITLLTTTSHTLSEIAYMCGFSSQAYFSFVFKRRFGITPRSYAKQEYERYLK